MRSTDDARAKALTVSVERVTIPARSTVGYGIGIDENGYRVRFVGDHRPLRHLGEALVGATEPIVVEVESWQVISIEELKAMKPRADVSPALRRRWSRSREVALARAHLPCFLAFLNRVRPGVLPPHTLTARPCPECASKSPRRPAVVLPLVRPTKQEPR